MLKLLALADRYSNIRGPKEARRDRKQAQTHAVDMVAIVAAVPDIARCNDLFVAQFLPGPLLGIHVRETGLAHRVVKPDLPWRWLFIARIPSIISSKILLLLIAFTSAISSAFLIAVSSEKKLQCMGWTESRSILRLRDELVA